MSGDRVRSDCVCEWRGKCGEVGEAVERGGCGGGCSEPVQNGTETGQVGHHSRLRTHRL